MISTSHAAIALDLGTTSIKAALLDKQGNLTNTHSRHAPTVNRLNGCYESDALDYLNTAEQVLNECCEQTGNHLPLGLCSQRSSFLIWDKSSGKPITPLISWQDNRGAHWHSNIQNAAQIIQQHTGLQLTPYYFAPKLSVILHDNPDWQEKLIRSNWLVGTLDTFLIWHWTKGQHYCTDASMAARTLLMDIHQQKWSTDLCQLFNIPIAILPEILPSTGLNLTLKNGLTLQASVGDQSAALFASVNSHSEALVNLGTGGFVIRYLTSGSDTINGYLQTLVYQDKTGHTQSAIEGTLNSIAAALAPYPIKDSRLEDLAANHIFCLAEPSGLGAPYFRTQWGIHFSEPVIHLSTHQTMALLLEAIIFRVARILEEFHHQSPLTRVYLSGGLSELPCLQQGIAQCTSIPIYYPHQKESSLQGAAQLAVNNKIRYQREDNKTIIKSRNGKLLMKYLLWKVWFDALLNSNR